MMQMDEEKEEEEEGEVDVIPSASERKERSLFAPSRLSVPSTRMVRRCMDSMMGVDTHTTIMSMRRLPLKHKTEKRRCRKIDKLNEEKFALKQEIKELKFENDSTIEISSQMKADVEMAMEENQSLEKENEELKSRAQTLEEKVKELQSALEKEKNENKRKETELVASY
ncbi:hypothetical protein Dimus_003539 [Dionaea muscipula]